MGKLFYNIEQIILHRIACRVYALYAYPLFYTHYAIKYKDIHKLKRGYCSVVDNKTLPF